VSPWCHAVRTPNTSSPFSAVPVVPLSPIYVDDRAGSIDLIKHEPLLSTAEVTRLDSGDVMFCGNGHAGPVLVGIEVKSIYDVVSSINTGRLAATQLPALLATYDVTWLLIYGTYGPGVGGRLETYRGKRTRGFRLGSRHVPYGYLEGFLCDLAASGVAIKTVGSEYAAAQWIGVLHRWWSKSWDKHKGLRAFDRSRQVGLVPGVDPDTHFRACVASQLPGLGYERAMAAAAYFPSVVSMVTADVSDWQRVPGVGKVIAGAIVEAIRRKRNGTKL
jgi:hypothetical protein